MGLRSALGRPAARPGDADSGPLDRGTAWLGRTIWAFVVLGVVLRLNRYAMNSPLWLDESYLAFNLIGRGYRELLRPLDYGQVCPPLFLWVEHTAVGALGFSEWSLRLFPAACGIASVLLFRHLAALATRGTPLLLAVAIFAVSIHPIRHAAEVKPYSCDLLMALVLLTPAFAWLRSPERVRWLWLLAASTPLAMVLSYPSAFIAGGIGLGLLGPVRRAKRWRAWVPFVVFGLSAVVTGLALFHFVAGAQGRAVMPWMRGYWVHAFPPLDGPGRFLRWWLVTTTGNMLAYPTGGRDGRSTLTFACLLAGSVMFWRGRRAELTILLIPFALTLAAAALRRYPYGGEARVMQHLAPAVCLLAGSGAAAVLGAFPGPSARPRVLAAIVLSLAAAGVSVFWNNLRHPYSGYESRVREFAQSFWPGQARDAELACGRLDFGIIEGYYRKGVLNDFTPPYLCNQMIYSPQRRAGGPRWDRVSSSRPLRCVLPPEVMPDDPAVLAWLEAMQTRYRLKRLRIYTARLSDDNEPPRFEPIRVFDFEPASPVPGPVHLGAGLSGG